MTDSILTSRYSISTTTFVPFAVSPPITFIGQTDDLSNASTYTFNSVSIGAAASDRIVVIAAHTDGGATAFSNINLDAQSATGLGQNIWHASTVTPRAGMAYFVVPTGTTATIVVTLTVGVTRCSIGVWTITGRSSSTPVDTDAPAVVLGSATTSATLDLPTGSYGVVAISEGNASSGNSWNVGTEVYDNSPEASMTASAATLTGTGASAVTVTSTHTSDDAQIVGAMWS